MDASTFTDGPTLDTLAASAAELPLCRLGDPYADEALLVRRLLGSIDFDAARRAQAASIARALIEHARAAGGGLFSLDALLREYPISTAEGVALLRTAEALLRVPDPFNADDLIADCVRRGDWFEHVGRKGEWLGTLSGMGLSVAKHLARDAAEPPAIPLVARLGEALVRKATVRAMHLLADQFVFGQTIDAALVRAARDPAPRYSFDMLGEGARTAADAEHYFAAYAAAIDAIGRSAAGRGPVDGPGVSIKLSALHPRYEEAQRARVWRELLPRLRLLADKARQYDIGFTIDAEESERLELSLELFEALVRDAQWQGCGLAVQAYQRRATEVVDWVIETARARSRRLMVRLVKGAYWDAEIKRAQEQGLPSYPVFTRKPATDVSYIACAQRLLAARGPVYPQFATHNPLTIASIMTLAGDRGGFELQRLHGMGESVYGGLREHPAGRELPCRVYAPVGQHRDLLAYLVRRLLENGANSSFVNQLADRAVPVETLLADPIELMSGLAAAAAPAIADPAIAAPADLFGASRLNSSGLDLSHPEVLRTLAEAMQAAPRQWHATSLVDGVASTGAAQPIRNPADRNEIVGTAVAAEPALVEQAFGSAQRSYERWHAAAVEDRAQALERAAVLLETHRPELLALLAREGGKTLVDGVAEVREAVDFCRYYASEARRLFARPLRLPGPTGESNELSYAGRGVFVCISPWNFPLAIFVGQVAAALAAGNAVIAKPAEQTPLIAHRAVRLLHEAGVPTDALQLVLGDGATLGPALTTHADVAGVAFTGSTETARIINRNLAAREAPIVPLIAETGGQNAMIVDSTALPEQVVDAVLTSAFRSAGQRCSALRVLYVQEEVADAIIDMLAGAARELHLGDPLDASTDVGPVIDEEARDRLAAHASRMEREAKPLFALDEPVGGERGLFFAPRAFAIDHIRAMGGEVFGPILHVRRFGARELDAIVDEINGTGFGLTCGIHTRIESRAEHLRRRIRAGNVYVNRSTIGAVVGVQPFGGEGLSGTGPKAGGPNYLLRFAVERTYTVNTAAAGGNVALLAGARRDHDATGA